MPNSKDRSEKYYRLVGENADKNNALCASVYYYRGGMNYFTGKNEDRGYYISLQPCTVENHMIGMTAFTGYKMLVKSVSRQSQKAFNEALKYAEENVKELFARWFPELQTAWEEF